jgi:glycosyltransferase involved in cell wall biosynthesis
MSLKIFIAIPWFSPAFKAGGPIKSIENLIRSYNEGIEYFVFCGNTDVDGTALQVAEVDCWLDFSSNTKVWYASQQVTTALQREFVASGAAVLYIVGMFDYAFNIYPLLFVKAAKKILSVRGMLHAGALSQKSEKKRFFLSLLKLTSIKKKVVFHATDEQEAGYVRKTFSENANVVVANNFSAAAGATVKFIEKEANSLKLITIALISPMKNHLLVLEALQHCTSKIEYTIYGAVKDDTYWYQCRELIRELPKNIFVHYAGELNPSLVNEKLAENHVFIMPSKSENFGHALAEALAMGKPIITSQNTPWVNLAENLAGKNVGYAIDDVTQAIQFYARLNQHEFNAAAQSALQYYKESQKNSPVFAQYQNLFFNA